MKALLILLGFITLFLGLLPFLQSVTFLSFLNLVPSSGMIYSIIIAAVGAIALYLGFRG